MKEIDNENTTQQEVHNTHKNEVATEFSRKREHEQSTSRKFVSGKCLKHSFEPLGRKSFQPQTTDISTGHYRSQQVSTKEGGSSLHL